MKRVLLSGLLLLLGAAPATFAQGAKDVIINELLVKNSNNYQDDYGHRVSWIELRNADVYKRQPLGGVQGQASDIEITAKQILRTKQELYEILSEHSGVDIKKIEQDADRDYWMTASEAKNYGLIDEVLVKRKTAKQK